MDDSRRTNILVGDDILVKIDDTKNVTHHNGVMTVEFNTIPNPLTIGVDAFHSSPNVPNPYIVRNNVSRQLATINDLENKADADHTHDYNSLTGTPPSSGGSTAFSVEFKHAGALTAGNFVDLNYHVPFDVQFLGGELSLGYAGGQGMTLIDIQTAIGETPTWTSISDPEEPDWNYRGFNIPRRLMYDGPMSSVIDTARVVRSLTFEFGTQVRCQIAQVTLPFTAGMHGATDLRVTLRFEKL